MRYLDMTTNRFTIPIKPSMRQSLDVTVIILTSSHNSRIQSYGAISLMMVDAYHNILDTQVDAINSVYPKSDIIITSRSHSREIAFKKPKNVRLVEIHDDSPGEVSDLRIALNISISSTVIVVDGNMIFNADAIKSIKNKGSCTLVEDSTKNTGSLGVTTDGRRVEHIAYGIPNTWCHMTSFCGKELELLYKYCSKKSKSNLCLFECINNITANGGSFSYIKNQGYSRRIAGPKDVL